MESFEPWRQGQDCWEHGVLPEGARVDVEARHGATGGPGRRPEAGSGPGRRADAGGGGMCPTHLPWVQIPSLRFPQGCPGATALAGPRGAHWAEGQVQNDGVVAAWVMISVGKLNREGGDPSGTPGSEQEVGSGQRRAAELLMEEAGAGPGSKVLSASLEHNQQVCTHAHQCTHTYTHPQPMHTH